jgi:hypothetical protein
MHNAQRRNVMMSVLKMAEFTVQQKVQCCYWLAELKFPIVGQRRCRQEYGQKLPE